MPYKFQSKKIKTQKIYSPQNGKKISRVKVKMGMVLFQSKKMILLGFVIQKYGDMENMLLIQDLQLIRYLEEKDLQKKLRN